MFHKGFRDIKKVLKMSIRELYPIAWPINILHIATLMTTEVGSKVSLYNDKIKEFAEALGIDISTITSEECLEKVICLIRSFRKDVGLPEIFQEFSIGSKDIKNIVDYVHNDPAVSQFSIPSDIIIKISNEVSGTSI